MADVRNRNYLTVKEAAVEANESITTIRRHITARKIAVHRPGGPRSHIRISKSDFAQYM